MLAGRSIARPVFGWPPWSREPMRRCAVPAPAEADCEPEGPDELIRVEPPDDDPPELEPLRGAADPLLPLDEDEGVRDPAGVCARGGSETRAGSGPLGVTVPPPPDEPELEELDPAGRGIAWANEAAGTAKAIARAIVVIVRGLRSITKLLHQKT
jgi:hypothetical protein